MFCRYLSEQLAVTGVIDPDAYTAAAYNTTAIDLSKFDEVIFLVLAGDLGSSGTIDFAVQESATTTDGDFAAMSPAKAITQMTQAGADDNTQAVVRVRAAELSAGKRYVRGRLTVGTATSDVAVIALAGAARHGPAADADLASVAEIVD